MKKISLLAMGALLFADASAMEQNVLAFEGESSSSKSSSQTLSPSFLTNELLRQKLQKPTVEEFMQFFLQIGAKLRESDASANMLKEYSEKVSQILTFLSLYQDEVEKSKSKKTGCFLFGNCFDLNADGKVDAKDATDLLGSYKKINEAILGATGSENTGGKLVNDIIDVCYDILKDNQTSSKKD
ncbi:MAG: hypothetical protein LBT63_01025 [Holosporaceae bacterium]|jgi:hypothetical protein|nr:hypothetical protein [Holosporaceae bacterium]